MFSDSVNSYIQKMVNNPSADGYALYDNEIYCDDGAVEFNGKMVEREWQIRISIYPEQQNLKKAATVLAPILIDTYNLCFKCLILCPAYGLPNKEEPVFWDGTMNGNDRDQRGKEICIYIRYFRQKSKYELEPSQIKRLILDCWKALLDNQVDCHYISPNIDEKPIKTDLGPVAPFSYSSVKPWWNRHGILHAKEYNPYNYPDPLLGVYLKKKDLDDAGITINLTQIQARLFIYQHQHYIRAENQMHEDLKSLESMSQNAKSFYQIVEEIEEFWRLSKKTSVAINSPSVSLPGNKPDVFAELEGVLTDYIFLNKEKFENIFKRFPFVPGPDEKEFDKVSYIKQTIKNVPQNTNVELTIEQLMQLKLCYATEAKPEINELLQEFRSNDFIVTFLSKYNMFSKVETLVNYYPQEMRKIYRRLVHMQREKLR